MSELTAKNLVGSGVKKVLVANRTYERAEDLASKINGSAIQWEELRDRLKEADIVITSTAATHYVLTPEMISKAMHARRNKPMFLIDIAVPRDVDPAVGRVGHAIDADEGAGPVRTPGDRLHVVQAAHDVGAMGDGHETCAIAQQDVQIL